MTNNGSASGAEARERGKVYDLVGVGFGPSNMALALAVEEAEAGAGGDLRSLFLEAKEGHAWHPNLMLEGSLIQITVLKDLVTVVNPRSRFTFLNYLKEKGRLYEFLNLRDLFPTRYEFNDYLGWVAEQLAARVRYGRRVSAVEAVVGEDGEVKLLRVRCRRAADGAQECFLARNLVVATGGVPSLPPGIELTPGGRAFHAHQFLPRLERDFPDRSQPYRFVVVGSGQTGAELFDYLMRRYPQADVTAAIRRFAFKPVDESHFTNEIFFPRMVDFYHGLPAEKRREFFASLKDVNYAVVDHPLIQRIYRTLYDERVQGKDRARVLPFLELSAISETGDEVVAGFRHRMLEEAVELRADALIVATGYTWRARHPLLAELAPYFQSDDDGGYRIERDYRIAAHPGFAPRVYLQGYCERSHGIGETVLSLVPVRAHEILSSLAGTFAPLSGDRQTGPVDALVGDGAGG